MWKEIIILLTGLAGLIFAEFGSFAWAVRKCALIRPPPPASNVGGSTSGEGKEEEGEPLLFFVAVSDLHVLGSKRSRFDVAWTTWQLRKSLYFLSRSVKPDIFLSLGDHLDQGGYASMDEWRLYVDRYRWATADMQKSTLVLDSIIGNHDAQFAHMGMTGDMLKRFESDFGSANGIVHMGDVEIVWVNSMALDDFGGSAAHAETEQHLARLANRTEDDATEAKRFRILLSHVPIHRENDLECGRTRLREGAHITYVGPNDPLQVGSDVLSERSSQRLLDAVKPNLILAGHLHTQCYRQIPLIEGSPTAGAFLEMTVPTLSYRMRPDPGFTVFVVHKGKVQGKTCKLPHEHSLIVMDTIAGLIFLSGLSATLLRLNATAKNKAE